MVPYYYMVLGDTSRLYGTCSDFGTAGWVFIGLTVGLNIGALVLACLQAYKARGISSEFSESRSLGLAIFCWMQILIVGGPVLFLISDDNPNAKYFLQIALIFVACLSMLLVIFGPIFSQMRGPKPQEAPMPMNGVVRVSGLNYNTNPTAGDSSQFSGPSAASRGASRPLTGSSDRFRPTVGSSDGFRLPPTPEEEVPSSSVEAQGSSGVEEA